ncbi:hypothetical protein P154DRAFT_308496 [Amniculicola lignicola CBS 123094]|uniref:Uncharacterized protein n=1 Tax=Amniculicola lignicola CBS 123094 TaxID=1392246 RepID=A0A6A5WBS5_9PLEO|nr:hypothetical protein P154DRAFT_308496 [Amniculicola lignicola CBS 123094]
MLSLKALAVAAGSFILATSPTLVAAADCYNDCGSPLTSIQHAYDALGEYCGTDRWQKYTDYTSWDPANGKPLAMLNSKPGANGVQVCWDGYGNIIYQCRLNGYCRGVYKYNGVIYSIGF